MPHPLFTLARKLERRHARRRQHKALENALTDPHLARDLGMPHRVKRRNTVDFW